MQWVVERENACYQWVKAGECKTREEAHSIASQHSPFPTRIYKLEVKTGLDTPNRS